MTYGHRATEREDTTRSQGNAMRHDDRRSTNPTHGPTVNTRALPTVPTDVPSN